jgi:predicted secreted protein
MLIKITLALALALAAPATAASYNNNATPIASLASGGGNLVPVW